jgi:hypothetical protein
MDAGGRRPVGIGRRTELVADALVVEGVDQDIALSVIALHPPRKVRFGSQMV